MATTSTGSCAVVSEIRKGYTRTTHRRDPQRLENEEARLRLQVIVPDVVVQKVAADGQQLCFHNRLVLLRQEKSTRLGPRAETVVQDVLVLAGYLPGSMAWGHDALRNGVRRLHLMTAAAEEELPGAIVWVSNILVLEKAVWFIE